VYSWGQNKDGQLGQGNKLDRPSPVPVEGLENVCGIAADGAHSYAVTQSGEFFRWGLTLKRGVKDSLRPILVEGFGGVRVRRVCAGYSASFAIGEDGELFSWGHNSSGQLGHGDTRDQHSPKRVEALRGVWVSRTAAGAVHALALMEDGLVYGWGIHPSRAPLGNPHLKNQLLPTPVEALRGVRVGSIAAGHYHSYAVADTGDLWA
jgi:alpha-tubulin suppressor-like RCC1 family protein